LATVAATSAGLAPGRGAWTEMVGISTSGSGETGSLKNARAPGPTRPRGSSVVATGRRIKSEERLIRYAIEVVADQLLSGRTSMQKPQNVTRYRHTPAAIV